MSTTSIILLSIAVFLVVVLIPVTVLVFVRKKLAPQGKVKININDEKEIEVEPGNSLLATLANEQIFLPSACGGGGSCGAHCNTGTSGASDRRHQHVPHTGER